MRLENFGASHATPSRLGWAALSALAVCIAGAGAFALSALCSPSIDAAAPATALSAWRAPRMAATGKASAKPAVYGDETLTRPVFAKSRRPFKGDKPGKQETAAAQAPAGMALRAVVGFGGKRRAFIVTSALAEGQWLGVGEALEGWTIAEMDRAFVTMKNGERSARLEIDYGAPQVQSSPDAPPPMVAAPPLPAPGNLQPQNRIRAIRDGAG